MTPLTCNLQQMQQPPSCCCLPVIIIILVEHARLVWHSYPVCQDGRVCGVPYLVAFQQYRHDSLYLIDMGDGCNMSLHKTAQHSTAHSMGLEHNSTQHSLRQHSI